MPKTLCFKLNVFLKGDMFSSKSLNYYRIFSEEDFLQLDSLIALKTLMGLRFRIAASLPFSFTNFENGLEAVIFVDIVEDSEEEEIVKMLKNPKSKSIDFLKYEWMVDSIITNGVILEKHKKKEIKLFL